MKCEIGAKHSLSNIRSHQLELILVLAVLLLIPYISKAQMFSVGEEGPRFDTPQSTVYAGVQPMNITYEGSSQEVLQVQGLFEFEGPLIRLGYESRLLNLFLGTGGAITGIDDVAYIDFGGDLNVAILLHNTKAVRLDIPIRITSRYVNMTNSEISIPQYNRFNFGSLSAGAGGRILLRPFEDFRLRMSAVPQYGFAFASGGFFGGSQASVAAEARLYFDHLFGDLGLSMGYKYDLRNYDIDDDVYDYKMKGHIFDVGITF